MLRNRTQAIVAATLCAAVATAAGADTIVHDSNNSEHGLGAFQGMIDYVDLAPTQGTLTITLTNVSDPSNGGFITGFVFNIDSADPNATATLTSWSHPFTSVWNHAAVPYGQSFTAGAALGGNWAGGGGSPSGGIGVGDTGTFVFDVFAADAGSLNPGSFITGPYDFNFVVRFRGFNEGGSDKVPGRIPAIPGPATLALLAAGVLVGRGRGRK